MPDEEDHESALADLHASFLDAEPPFERVLLAIGHTVVAAATLEKILMTMIAQRRIAEHEGLPTELTDLLMSDQRSTAGRLLNLLKGYGLPEDLAGRIQDVIRRRNLLVHHPLDDAYLLAALSRGEEATDVATRILSLAEDCDRLMEELRPAAMEGIESALGTTIPDLMTKIEAVDAGAIADPEKRTLIEQFQEMRRINPIPHPAARDSNRPPTDNAESPPEG